MSIRNFLKRQDPLLDAYKTFLFYKQKLAYKINPKYEANKTFKRVFGRNIDWKHPHNLIEKIMWMEFNTDISLWTLCADKYRVREYVKQCGCEKYLNPLLAYIIH